MAVPTNWLTLPMVWAVGDASPYKIIQIRPRQGTPQLRITNYELRIKTERMLL